MIYTITLNPSVDYSMTVPHMTASGINRSEREGSSFGGKGINVSAVLGELGVPSVVLGFSGGYTGSEIERLVRRKGLSCNFIKIREDSRINVKVTSEKECAINGKGPMIYLEEEEALLSLLGKISGDDIVVLSGKAPESESGRLLENVMEALSHTRLVADMEGDGLSLAISKKPYLIKPNEYELASLFGKTCLTEKEVTGYAAALRRDGVGNVLVSLGERGAYLASEDGSIYKIPAPKVDVVNTTGAGDSLLGGFLAGLSQGKDPGFCLALGVAAGSATAATEFLAEGESILSVFAEM